MAGKGVFCEKCWQSKGCQKAAMVVGKLLARAFFRQNDNLFGAPDEDTLGRVEP
jgi:hypothetical protein